MRFHSRYPLLQLWLSDGSRIARAQTLNVARLEPVVTDPAGGAATLDLIFSDGESIAVIPFILIDPCSIVRHERTPIIWPRAARSLGLDTLRAIEDVVLPWLQTLVLARQQNDEAVKHFSNVELESEFKAARAAGFLGAARYDESMPAFAPYVYAARFCYQSSIGIIDEAGGNGAAMLAARAEAVKADLCSAERNALAARWFGLPAFGEVAGAYDVAVTHAEARLEAGKVRIVLDAAEANARVVPVASSVPVDILVSFDPEDAPVARTFSVHSNLQLQVRSLKCAPTPAAAGGSSGSILLLMRDDFERAPNADVDEAVLLASRLRAEGFSVDVSAASAVSETYRPDLVHAFTVTGHSSERLLRGLHERGVPIVANPNLGSAPAESDWGPDVLASLYARVVDEAKLAEHLELVRLRRLSTENFTPASLPVHALPYVDVALVTSQAEGAHVKDVLGFRGDVVSYTPIWSSPDQAQANVSSLVGSQPFAFVHAPVDWRTNISMLATATAAHGFLLVITGPMVNFGCFRHAWQLAPERIIHVPTAGEAELDALYRSAHVYADVAWGMQGHARLARAAASGCRLLVSQGSWAHAVWDGAVAADSGSVPSLVSGLAQAWSAAAPVTRTSGADLFSASIFAYSRAAAARQPA